MYKKLYLIVVFLLITGISCKDAEKDIADLKYGDMIKSSDLASLQSKIIFFGHQSVGFNIIEGLNSLKLTNSDLDFLKIITYDEYLKSQTSRDDSSCYFIHSVVGRNRDPEAKLNEFVNKIDTLGFFDAALIKFCYADINRFTDVDLMYYKYIQTISSLADKYGRTKFVYITSPLMVKRSFLIRLLKTILNRPDDNINRNKFNRLLRETNDIRIFDLAFLESHLENDKRVYKVEYLHENYTYDGGHLNKHGSEKVAYHLLTFLESVFQD